MTDEIRPVPNSLRERRERVIERLTRHFADDHIDAREFERRLDLAYRAHSVEEIEALHSDLPALDSTPTAAVRTAGPGDPVRQRQWVVALLGGTERKGGWTPARQVNACALMGGLVLDFREARFLPGVTELTVVALMGGVEIIVPPGIRVECDGSGILGGFECLDQHVPYTDGDRPTLRIRGVAIMGGVEVTERLPRESGRDRKRRLREEKQKRRGLGGG